VPPRPKTIGVFGAVYQASTFLYRPGSRISDYLKLAGGPQRFADRGDIFVVRANGAVLSRRVVHDLGDKPAIPGDVVFVPVKARAGLLDRIFAGFGALYPAGVSAATLVALGL
jgi:protein involved in polysaccharide export with SLBB domain